MCITYARGLGCIVPACSWHFLLTRIWHTYNCDDTMSMPTTNVHNPWGDRDSNTGNQFVLASGNYHAAVKVPTTPNKERINHSNLTLSSFPLTLFYSFLGPNVEIATVKPIFGQWYAPSGSNWSLCSLLQHCSTSFVTLMIDHSKLSVNAARAIKKTTPPSDTQCRKRYR